MPQLVCWIQIDFLQGGYLNGWLFHQISPWSLSLGLFLLWLNPVPPHSPQQAELMWRSSPKGPLHKVVENDGNIKLMCRQAGNWNGKTGAREHWGAVYCDAVGFCPYLNNMQLVWVRGEIPLSGSRLNAAVLHASRFSRSLRWEETKKKWQESTGCFLIVSDCLVYFPRPWPPINPVIYVRLGQSQSCVAMVRDCLHPVMLHSHVGSHADTHTHCSMLFCLCTACYCGQPPPLPQPPGCFKNWPPIASSSVVERLYCGFKMSRPCDNVITSEAQTHLLFIKRVELWTSLIIIYMCRFWFS